MFDSLWFQQILGRNTRRVRRRQAALNRRTIPLRLEGLEDRITPSTLPFATAANVTELQSDIAFVNANLNPPNPWVIKLAASTTFQLTAQQELVNGANVQFLGLGNDTITPAALSRAFKVDSGGYAQFDNLTLSGGRMSATGAGIGGAAILDAGGNVTLSNANVTNNTVFSNNSPATQGGGIFVSGSAYLTIKNSTIANNHVFGTNGFFGPSPDTTPKGGGIFVSGGVVNISNSELSNNSAVGGNGSAGAAGEAHGGAMGIVGGNVTLENSTVVSNYAKGGNGTNGETGGEALGGAFSVGGDASFRLASTEVDDNSAEGGTSDTGQGGEADGGAVYASISTSTATILNSSFFGNSASGGSGGTGGSAAGAIAIYNDTTLNLLNSTLGLNSAQGGNGTTQAAYAEGGGLYVYQSTVPEMFNDTIVFNKADGGTGPVGNGFGGGAYFQNASQITAINTLVQGNTTNGTGADVNSNPTGSGTTNNVIGTTTIPVQVESTAVAIPTGNGNTLTIYRLLPNATAAIAQGTPTTALNVITTAEFNLGVIAANDPTIAVDEVGNQRTVNGAGTTLNLGAVQSPPSIPSPSPSPSPAPPALDVPPLLAFIDSILGGTETVNSNGTETITDRFLGFTLFVSTFNSSGNLVSVTLLGFNITFLFG